MVQQTAFWSFIGVLRQHWFAAMSGGFSVPFTAAAIYFDSKYAHAIFGGLALASLYFAAYQIWKTEHDKVLVLQESLSPTRIREIEAREGETVELRRRNDAIEADRLSERLKPFVDRLMAAPPPLNIVVGTGGLFEQIKMVSTRDRHRTFYLKIENTDRHKPLRNCKVDIQSVMPIPNPDRGMPWTVEQDFSLAAGEHKFVKLACYQEYTDPDLELRWRMKLMQIFSNDPQNWLLLAIEGQTLKIRATSPDSGYCDVTCKLWVDENWRFHIEKI